MGDALAVDDDEDLRAVLVSVLEEEGLVVLSTGSGVEAVELLKRKEFSIVISDIGVPDLNGWIVAKMARRLRPGMPIYLITGWSSQLRFDRSAVDGLFLKPFTREEILEVLDRHELRRKR